MSAIAIATPCTLSQDKILAIGCVSDQVCKAKYKKADGIVYECGALFTEHRSEVASSSDDTKKRSFSVLEQEDLVNAKFAKLEDTQRAILKSLEANKSYYPSMSPAQEGAKIMTERLHTRIPPEFSDLPSVLTTGEQVSEIDPIKNEYLLVAHMTLKLAPILNTYHRYLVNSENYPWLRFLDITTFVIPTTTTSSTQATTTTTSDSTSSSVPLAPAPPSAFPDPTPHDEKPDLWLGPSFILHRMGDPLTMHGAKSIGGVATNEYRCSRSNEEKKLYKQGIPDPKHYYWFDCLSPLAAKLEMTYESIGELKNYLSTLSDPRDMAGLGQSIYAEKCRGMLITRKQFLLLECQGNIVTQSCIGEWTQPGSIKFIQEFFHPINQWLLAMEHVTKALNAQDIFIIDIIKPLGRGANGRVVECKYRYADDTKNNACISALKVIVGKDRNAINQFYNEYQETQSRITQVQASQLVSSSSSSSSTITTTSTTTSSSNDNTYYSPLACLLPSRVHHFYCSDFQKSIGYYGCYMLDPIGIPIDYNKLYTSSSLFIDLMQSLQSLHRNGITHGDARLPNIIKRPSTIATSQHPIIDLKRAIATQKKIHPSVQRLSLVGGIDGFTVPTAVELTVRTRTPTLTITIESMQDKMASPYPERAKKEAEMVEKDKKMIVRLGAASPSIPPSALIPNIKKGPLPANFQVDPKDTILDLKFLLADIISIAPEYQRLYIRRRGERSLIHDAATITSAGIVNGEILKVQFEYPSNQPHHGTIHRTAIKLTEFDHPQIPDLGTNFRVASVKYANRKFLGVRSFSSDLKSRGPYVWQTYNDIATRVSNFAAGMRHLGLTKGDTIGIMSQNRTEWIIADLVCSVQSFVSVPLYDTLGHDAAKYIINHASVKAVVVSVAQLKDIVAIRSQCPTLSFLIVMDDTPLDKHNLKTVTGYTHKFSEIESNGSKYVTTYPDVLPGYNDLSTICYTSGTTGNPKGVLLTHGNLIATIAAFNERLRQEPQLETETVLSYLPLAHIYERIVDSTLISEGYAIGFFQGDTLKLAEDVAELKPTVFPGVPRVWQRIYDKIHAQIEESNIIRRTLFDKAYQSRLEALRNGDTSPSLWDKIVFKKVAERFGGNIRMLSSGAAPLPAKVAEFMKIAFMCHFLEGYGLTETCAAATSMSVDDTQFGNVGAVQGSVEIKLVSVPDMEYLVTDKPNPRGEIWIRGPSIFKGYYKQPEATKECMTEDGWFMSGDVGTWLPNGNLKIIDRKKNIFKLSQGEYIKPEHIENILKQSKLVANIYVHGDSQQNFLVGVVVPDFEALKPLAVAAGSKAKTPAELVADPKVEKLLMSDLNRISAEAKLQKFEYVKRIHISKDDFTVDNGLLTPTFKLKRFVCAKHYARELSDLYAKGLPAEEKIQSKL